MGSNMNYFMKGMDVTVPNGYGDENNADLNDIFDNPQYGASNPSNAGGMNEIYSFGSVLIPNGMNIDDGMTMEGSFAQNNMFQPGLSHGRLQYEPHTSGFAFPQQADPAVIMRSQSQSLNGIEGSESSRTFANSQEQAGGMACSQASDETFGQSEEPETFIPKPKRTRQSKKKPLTKEQQEAKREELLERNRVAASKCRKRKQEQTNNLQESAQRLTIENDMLRQDLMGLQQEIAQLSQMLLSHTKCNSPALEAQIAQFKSTSRHGSFSYSRPGSAHSYGGSARGLPVGSPAMSTLDYGELSPPPWGMARTDSAISYGSGGGIEEAYNPDGSLNIRSPLLNNRMLNAENKKRLAKDEAYVKALEMSRKHSNASNMTGTSDASGKEASGYTSTITTPENPAKESLSPKDSPVENTLRRGLPRKSLQNPRSPTQQRFPVGPALGLQGLQDPSDFIAQQQP